MRCIVRVLLSVASLAVDSSWNVVAYGDAREGKWRGNWRMEWVASTLHTTSEHGESSITTADAHTSAAISRLNWRPWRFKWTRPFRRETKSGFYACAITFQTQPTMFFHIISWTARFSGKKLLNTKCVFWFSPQLLSETFLILRRIHRHVFICIGLHLKYPLFLSDFVETWIFTTYYPKILKFQIAWKSI